MITFLSLVAAVLATWLICKRIYGKPQGKWQKNTDLPNKYEIHNPDDVLEFYKDVSSKLFQSEECVPEDVRNFFDEPLNSKNIESMCRVADFFERELVIVKKGVEVEESEEQQEEVCEQVEEVKEVEPTQIDYTEEEYKREEKEEVQEEWCIEEEEIKEGTEEEKEEIKEGEQEKAEEHELIDIEENEQDSCEESSEADTQDKETYIAFFDVETSGLTPPSMYEIMQLSYIITTLDWNIVKRVNHYFPYPDEDRIEYGAIDANGLTKEFLDKQTLSSRKEALEQFFSDLKDVRLVVAHNAEFDMGYINSTVERYGVLSAYWPPSVYDTMKETKEFCAIPSYSSIYNDYKWPKLSELADCLDIEYNESELHNSMVDAELTMECFKKLYALGEVSLQWMVKPNSIVTEEEFYSLLSIGGNTDEMTNFFRMVDLYSHAEEDLRQVGGDVPLYEKVGIVLDIANKHLEIIKEGLEKQSELNSDVIEGLRNKDENEYLTEEEFYKIISVTSVYDDNVMHTVKKVDLYSRTQGRLREFEDDWRESGKIREGAFCDKVRDIALAEMEVIRKEAEERERIMDVVNSNQKPIEDMTEDEWYAYMAKLYSEEAAQGLRNMDMYRLMKEGDV